LALQIMYGIDGHHQMPEQTLDHLEGYRGSRPVRVGNGACEQLQLDIYGELMDSVYLYDKYGSPIAYDSWSRVRRAIEWVADNWMRPDDGIWEVRGGQQQFIYSKVQCWVALDRAIRLATKRSLPLDHARLLAERDRIYEAVMTQGWDAERRTFVRYFGTDALDAANLIMPLVFFISPTDPRMIGTINRTMAELVSEASSLAFQLIVPPWVAMTRRSNLAPCLRVPAPRMPVAPAVAGRVPETVRSEKLKFS
jgi:GH15 family glucan-1,4-alpha-glucosidase